MLNVDNYSPQMSIVRFTKFEMRRKASSGDVVVVVVVIVVVVVTSCQFVFLFVPS